MDISVVLVVLGAAFLHAFWNFQVRSTEDKALGMAAVMFGHLPLAIIGLVLCRDCLLWPYVFVSALLHRLSGVFVKCLPVWRINPDLPCCPRRGLLITLFTMVTVPGVLKTMEVIGVILVSGAIITYGIVQYRSKSVGFTGIVLGCYHWLFYCQLFDCGCHWHSDYAERDKLLWCVDNCQCGIVGLLSDVVSPTVIGRVYRDAPRTFVIGGNASYFAYVAVLWACLSAPVAVVSSLRETSVLFAVVLGVLVLKEKMTTFKIAIILTIFLG